MEFTLNPMHRLTLVNLQVVSCKLGEILKDTEEMEIRNKTFGNVLTICIYDVNGDRR